MVSQRLIDRPGPDAADLIEVARANFDAGEFRRSAEVALEAAALAASHERPDLVVAAALVSTGVPDAATAATAERLCRQALAVVDESSLALRGRLEAQLSVALHHREEFDASETHLELATCLAEESRDPRARSAALHARLLSIAGRDAGPMMLTLADEMLEPVPAHGSAVDELYARSWRIDGLMRSGETIRVGFEIDALDVLATRTRSPLVRWNAALARAGLFQAIGRFRDAEERARAAREALPASQRHQTEPLFVAQLMLVSTDRGSEPPELEMVRAMAIGAPLIVGTMMARFDLEMGDRPRALAGYEAARPRLEALPIERRTLPTLMAAAELAAAFGDASAAATLRARLQPFDGTFVASSLGAVGPLFHGLAQLDRVLGSIDTAIDHAEAAAELSARGGFGPWLARSRLTLAECLLARNRGEDRARARRTANLAAIGARDLGMARLEDRAARFVEGLEGSRPLSAREREVAALVARGSSNRDIAAEFGLSDRTVETHVQNILTKLGFHARTQIAAWAAQERLADDADR